MKSYGANKTLEIPAKAKLESFCRVLDLRDKRTRRTINKLVRLQQRWIDNEGLQGIQRSKQLLFLWNKWVACGCDPSVIPPLRYKHSLISKLTAAMRLVCLHADDVGLINLITTALRLHQCYGVSDTVIERLTLESYNTITRPFNPRPLIFALEDERDFVYGHGLNEAEYNAYLSARLVRDFLRSILDYRRVGSDDPNRLFGGLRGVKPRLELERMEQLVKAGPMRWKPRNHDWVALKSIISEPLDVLAMDRTPSVFTRQIVRNPDGAISLRQHAQEGRTVHDIVDDLSTSLLRNPHCGDTGLVYQSSHAVHEPPPNFQIEIGRIVPIKDKAGKIRNIAMTCYTVNKALGPIHRWLFDLLDRLPCDSTKQQRGVDRMVKATIDHEACESKDLSSATDRLPLVVQRRILESLLSYCAGWDSGEARKFAQYWHELLASLTFRTPRST